MIRCGPLLLLFFAVQLSYGQENATFETGGYNTFRESPPFPLNGHGVRVALEGDYNKGTRDEVYLDINIDAANDTQIIKYGELSLQVLDTEGKVVDAVLKPANEDLRFESGQLCAGYKLKIHKGQKIESVKITWGNSERTFLYSKREIKNVYSF
jgi:hypothetical protein